MNPNNYKLVGHLVKIYRYPVKSMAPETLKAVDISWFGLSGDRRWAFIRNDVIKSDFPWLTIRDVNNMNHFKPYFINKTDPDKSDTMVKTPTGKIFDITNPILANELYPKGARIIKQARGVFDTFPLSLITTQTVESLAKSLKSDITPERFRPNFLVKTLKNEPYPEDKWVGKTLLIGNMRMRIDKRDGRCAVITIDPITSEKNSEVLKQVYKNREGCLGIYGSTVTPGKVSIYDEVYIEY